MRTSNGLPRAASALAFVAVFVACSGPDRSAAPGVTSQTIGFQYPGKKPVKVTVPISIGPSKIQHVIFLVQENRSFDYIFGGLDKAGKPFPGADTVSNPDPGEPTPHDHLGNVVKMKSGLLEECYSPDHDLPNADLEIDNGKMDAFDEEDVEQLSCAPGPAPTDYVYRFAQESEVSPYWLIGEQYATSDRMFEAIKTSSFAAHLFFVAAQTAHSVDNPAQTPWGCDSAISNTVDVYNEKTGGIVSGVYPCFDIPTLADEMDARGIGWRYYGMPTSDFGYNWISYDAIDQIRNGPDWAADVITPSGQFVTDIAAGKLQAMTWVTPSLADSDHPISVDNAGPSWIATAVNAVGKSKFWDSTAMIITWDDWGGCYDPGPPPTTSSVGLGLRVPLIVVSAYAKHGYVSHIVHSTGSMLHFTEEALGLPSLGQLDSQDDDLADMFAFNKPPRKFKKFSVPMPPDAVVRSATQPRGARYGGSPSDD
jgi:phospholipase C